MTDRFFKTIYDEYMAEQNIDMSNFRIGHEHPIALPLKVAAQNAFVAADLAICVLKNDTDLDFITSDNPLVVHNQFCEAITWQGVLGWNCSGIQVLFPISPRHVILLYDAAIYAVGTNRNRNILNISNRNEVNIINDFQMLNANYNIYFCQPNMSGNLINRIEQLKTKRNIKRNMLIQTERVSKEDGQSEIVHIYERILPLKLYIAGVRLKRNARRIQLRDRAKMYRKELKSPGEGPSPGLENSIRYPVRRSFAD